MKSRYVLDTNFLSAFLNPEDFLHKRALKIFLDMPEESAYTIPATVRLELIIFRLHVEEFATYSYEEVFSKLNVNILNIDDGFLMDMEGFVLETRFPLKLMDYAVLFTAFETKSELITFDKKLEKYYKMLR